MQINFFHKINPTIITILAVFPPVLFFIFLANRLYVLALFAFLGSFLDVLDGFLAKKYNKVTTFGGFLDSTLDRVSDFFYITAFGFGGIVRWELATIALGLSFLISYIRSRGELASEGTIKLNIGLIERPQRLVLLFLALFSYALFPPRQIFNLNSAEVVFIILIVLSCFTILQRLSHTYKNL